MEISQATLVFQLLHPFFAILIFSWIFSHVYKHVHIYFHVYDIISSLDFFGLEGGKMIKKNTTILTNIEFYFLLLRSRILCVFLCIHVLI